MRNCVRWWGITVMLSLVMACAGGGLVQNQEGHELPAVSGGSINSSMNIVYQLPSRPYENLKTLEWRGSEERIAPVLDDMVAKAIQISADALYVKKTTWSKEGRIVLVDAEAIRYRDYEPSSLCKNCHTTISDQYAKSMHSNSASNPVYLAQYFKELVPQLARDSSLKQDARHCTACHNPVEFIRLGEHMILTDQTQQRVSAVTCDFCHSLKGIKGKEPGDGNYISEPISYGGSQHNHLNRYFKKSEFCAVCHNGKNHNGLEIKSTYTEWKNSVYAQGGIHCQQCHMNREGFLREGRESYDKDRIVSATMFGKQLKKRKIFNHSFPGAHAMSQLDSSLGLAISMDSEQVKPGQSVPVHVTVDNVRAGHKMPTGSVDIRLLWLDLYARVGDRKVPLQLISAPTESWYARAGEAADDLDILYDVPAGSRVYRAVLVDQAGRLTRASYNAERIVFDNRLDASEERPETYSLDVPSDASGAVSIEATLYYLSYPSVFARKLEIPLSESHSIATARKEITVTADSAAAK